MRRPLLLSASPLHCPIHVSCTRQSRCAVPQAVSYHQPCLLRGRRDGRTGFAPLRLFSRSRDRLLSGAPAGCGLARRWHSAPASTADTADVFEAVDEELDAYEALLLDAQTPAPEMPRSEDTSDADPWAAVPPSPPPPPQNHPHHHPQHQSCTHSVMAPVEASTEDLLADVLAALPADGSAVRLTDITRTVDVESISARFGSVRQFLEAFPSDFTCTSELAPTPVAGSRRTQARWYVQRRRPLSGTARPDTFRAPTARTPAAASMATSDRVDSAALEDVQRLMSAYLDEALAEMASSTTIPATASSTAATTTTEHTQWSTPAASEETRARTDDEPVLWDEVIPFEDDDMDDAPVTMMDSGATEGQAPAREGDGVSTVAVLYDPGDTKPRATGTGATPPAPKPRKKKAHPPSSSAASRAAKVVSRTDAQAVMAARSPEELEALHTALAERRGWRTPRQLLDLLVACVPTYFVPLSDIVATDALAKVLGPRNTMRRVLEIHHYFFDFQDGPGEAGVEAVASTADTPVVTDRLVRLRVDLPHPHRGDADGFYRAPLARTACATSAAGPADAPRARPTRLQSSAVTASFAALQSTIPSPPSLRTLSARPRTLLRPPAAPAPGGCRPLTPGANLFDVAESGHVGARQLVALCLTVPHTRFVSVPEAASAAGLDAAQALAVLHDEDGYVAHHALFLRRPAPAVAAAVHDVDTGREASPVQLRLRPFFLSPSATDDVAITELAEPLRRQLRPTWLPLGRFLTKLPEAALSDLQIRARALRGAAAQPRLDSAPFQAEAEYLMQFGRLCWLQQRHATAARTPSASSASSASSPRSRGLFSIRAFTSDATLDDSGAHVLTMLLHRYAHPTQWQTLAQVCQAAEEALLPERPDSARACDTTRFAGGVLRLMEAQDQPLLVAFLQKQQLVLEVELREASESALPGEQKVLWIRRRTAFGSFTRA